MNTPLKEADHDRTPTRLHGPASNGGGLIVEAALAAVLHLSTPASTTTAIQQAAAVSPMPQFSRCVEQRESGGNPRARNRAGSSAQGLFQFLSAWRRGLPYMVAERLRDHGMPAHQAKTIRITLAGKEIASWPAVYQRIGHAEVLERGGWRHWSLPGHPCQRLVGH